MAKEDGYYITKEATVKMCFKVCSLPIIPPSNKGLESL